MSSESSKLPTGNKTGYGIMLADRSYEHIDVMKCKLVLQITPNPKSLAVR